MRKLVAAFRGIVCLSWLIIRKWHKPSLSIFALYGGARIRMSGKAQVDIGHGCEIEAGTLIKAHNARISIGIGCYFNRNSQVIARESISIGKCVLIGDCVSIYDHDHATRPQDKVFRKYDNIHSAPIVVEDNVWIGSHVVILKGVTIGENAVVAAGSVVTKDVARNTLVGGVPAKRIKSI